MQPTECDQLVHRLLKQFAPQIAKNVASWRRARPSERDPMVIIAATKDTPRLTEVVSRLEMIAHWDNAAFPHVIPALRNMPPAPTNAIDVIIVTDDFVSIIRNEFSFMSSALNPGKNLPS